MAISFPHFPVCSVLLSTAAHAHSHLLARELPSSSPLAFVLYCGLSQALGLYIVRTIWC